MLQDLVSKLNEAMSAIQNLQIQPTQYNCSKIIEALTGIRDAANIGAEMNAEIEKLSAKEQPEENQEEETQSADDQPNEGATDNLE